MRRKPIFYLALTSLFLLCSPADAGETYGTLSGHSITVDGSVSDWVGIAPTKPDTGTINKGEFIWEDALGDDTGNGRYTYPKNPAMTRAADLKEFRVTWDSRNVYFLIKTTMPGEWWAPYRVIAIDTDGAGGGRKGMRVIQQGDIDTMDSDSGTFGELRVSSSLAADYVIVISGTYRGMIWDAKGKLVAKTSGEKTDTPGFKIKDSNVATIEIQVPHKIIGSPQGRIWRFIVATGIEDHGHAREIYREAEEWHGGGGEDTVAEDGVDPDFYDLASPDQNTQEIELAGYGANAPAGESRSFTEIKKSYLEIKFSPFLSSTPK